MANIFENVEGTFDGLADQKASKFPIDGKIFRIMGLIGTLAVLGCSRSESQKQISPPVNSVDLFAPNAQKIDIKREDIPNKLQALLGELALVQAPKDYDPNLPNLYFFPTLHMVDQPTRHEYEQISKCQKASLKIFHILFSLGVHRALLEGIPNGTDYRHDKAYGDLKESPLDHFREYKRHNTVLNATAAFEAIYKDQVDSIGIDESLEQTRYLFEEQNRLDNETTRLFRKKLLALAAEFEIPVDERNLRTPEDVLLVRDKISSRVKNMTKEQVDQIIQNLLFSDPDFNKYLDDSVKLHFYVLNGRPSLLAQNINKRQSDKQDAVSMVSAGHAKDLHGQIKGWNVFTIKVPFEEVNEGGKQKEIADYKKLKLDMFLFKTGLIAEPGQTFKEKH